ncbi:MAG: TrmH family RNA methyltransferase [Fusobacteriaceae bacterium]
MERIVTLENSLLKKIKKLKQKKYREEEGLFIAEGLKFLTLGEEPVYIVVREDIWKNIEDKINKFSCKKIILEEKLFKQLSSQENSQGLLLVYPIKKGNLNNLSENIVILDKVGDPGNLGTIIRLCDAVGFKDIIMTKGTVDCYGEKVVRSTMGSIFSMNLYYGDEDEILNYLKKNDYKIFVTALDEKSISYNKMKLQNKNAIVFGNEGSGVSEKFLKESDEKIIIPIYGTAESLNVAIATGIVLYKVRELLN